MKQPVRNVINDVHAAKLIDPIYTLLIDGTNLLRISFADTKVNSNGEHIGGIFQFLLQLRMLLQKKNWNYVYVFFDDENSGILRYKFYKDYKSNRNKKYDLISNVSDYQLEYNKTLKNMQNYFFNQRNKNNIKEDDIVEENFCRERELLMKYFNELFIRWMMDDETEGDDLIAYYVLNKKDNEKIVIVSSDEDLTQLLSDDVYIYNPRLKKNITNINFNREYGFPYTNVLVKKIVCGDKSDNIGNIMGVSEKTLFDLIPEIREVDISVNDVIERAKLLNEERIKNKKKPLKYCENIINGVSNKQYDGNFYEINEKIINLKKPLLTETAKNEIDSMMYAPQDPEDRSFKNLYQFMIDDEITELKDVNKFTNFFAPFNKYNNDINKHINDE